MPITAVRITVKGQQAVRYLTTEVPANQKRPVLTDEKADKLSLRKQLILVATVDGRWYPNRRLQRRLADTGEFDEWTSKVDLATFQRKGLGDKLVNELINLSEQGYLQLGRNLPRTCSVCGEIPDHLITIVTMNNNTWDGSEAHIKEQTTPLCPACFEKQHA